VEIEIFAEAAPVRPRGAAPAHRRPVRAVVTATSSDSHTWNLVFLELVLSEWGAEVVNLGPCVPEDLLIDHCLREPPDLVVVSSVNGHGYADGARLIRAFRAWRQLDGTRVVIGGKLGIGGVRDEARATGLIEAGFDRVFDGEESMAAFRGLVQAISSGTRR